MMDNVKRIKNQTNVESFEHGRCKTFSLYFVAKDFSIRRASGGYHATRWLPVALASANPHKSIGSDGHTESDVRFLYTARKQRAWSRERVDRGWKRAKGKSESQKKKDERNDEAVVKREALHAFQSCSNLHRGNEEGVCLPSRRMLYPLYSHTLHPFSSCSSSLYAERGNRDPWISKASWLYERALFFGTPFNPNFNPLKSQRLLKIKGYQRHVIGLSLLFNYFLCENIFSETFMWKYPQKSLQPFSIFFLKSVSTSWTHWNSMWKHLQHDQKWEKIKNFNI